MRKSCVRIGLYAGYVLAVAVASPGVVAQEICGVASVYGNDIFKDGFDPFPGTTGAAKSKNAIATNRPFAPIFYSPSGGPAPTVTITFPASSPPLDTLETDIAGTYTGPSNIGIVIDGKRAYVQGGQFLIPRFNLIAGATNLNAQASTITGQSASNSRNISATEATRPADWSTIAPVGIAPFRVPFRLRALNGSTIQSISVDFNGDAVADFTGTDPALIPAYTYTAPGLFTASVTVTGQDAAAQPFNVTLQRRVLIASIVEHRERLCSVFAHMRQELATNDVLGALQALTQSLRDEFQPLFNAFGANRPAVAAALGTLTNGLVGLDRASLTLTQSEGGQLYGHAIDFVPDDDGVWRIREM